MSEPKAITERTRITIGLAISLMGVVVFLSDMREKSILAHEDVRSRLAVLQESIGQAKEVQLRIITKVQVMDTRIDTINTNVSEIKGEMRRLGRKRDDYAAFLDQNRSRADTRRN